MKTKQINGYAIYSPLFDGIVLGTVAKSRAGSIRLTGCISKKTWMNLYRQGFKTIKVSVKY